MNAITLNLENIDNSPKYLQIYEYIKNDIKSGKIQSGVRLPSIRELANHLKVSRNTVDTAYQQLIAEGYVISRNRSGLFVQEIEEELAIDSNKFLHHEVNNDKDLPDNDQYKIDFRHGYVDRNSFPFSTWRKLHNEVLRKHEIKLLHYGEQQGEPDLRQEIAKYLYQSRGVSCTLNQVVIGAGIQQLLLLLSQLIGLNGQSIAMEEPGYDGARSIFKNLNFEIKPIPLEHDGISIEQLALSKAKIVYVTPSHQFPCGMVLPITKRIKLLKWAEKNDGLIIEDDYDGEFRYHTKPIPSLQGLDSKGNVVYLGTFSKSLLPSLRISYMVLPSKLLKHYLEEFKMYEQTVSKIHQETLQKFIKEGHWERHIRKMRNIYEKKHVSLIEALKNHMDDKVRVIGKDSGLHILVEVENNMTEQELIEAAKKVNVKVYPTSNYWMNSDKERKPGILLGFPGLTEEEINEGIKLLKQAWL